MGGRSEISQGGGCENCLGKPYFPRGEMRGHYIGRARWQDDENTPDDLRYPSRASGDRGRDRRRCIRTPIPTKLRPTRSVRRARRSYLTAVTFRQHFSVPHKITRLIIKRGFRSGGDGWSCADSDGARVKPGVAKSSVRVARVCLRPIREI